MKSQALRAIIWGQACFYGGLLVAIALKPAGLGANSGISYYGIFAETVIPYEISLIGGAICTWLCALHIAGGELKPIRNTLFAMAAFTLVVGFTPYSIDNTLNNIHRLAGTLLFTVQLLLSFWLTSKLRRAFWTILLTAIELIAGIACAIYLNPVHGYLIQSQVLFQLAFGVLLIYSLGHLLPETLGAKAPELKERAG